MADHLRLEVDEGGEVAVLTLNRPARLNALTLQLMDDLQATFTELGRDRRLRVVILTGAGRGFCAGLDLQQREDPFSMDEELEVVYARQEKVANLALAMKAMPQPIIAAVNGPASGGGLALALAADVRICARTALFNVAFVRVGLSGCDVGVSHLLPRIVGLGIASELMLTGRRVEAEEAARIGLANRVVDDGQLLAEARELAAEIAANSPFGVRMTKEVLHRNVDATSLDAAIDLENRTQVLAARTRGAAEALSAYAERRPARYAPVTIPDA
jgi:enoyl-CoA hydratase